MSLQFYRRYDGPLIAGGDVVGFGYPVEGSDTGLPVGRTFKGHIQRTLPWKLPDREKGYLAAELNIPAPGGWSGGPIAFSHEYQNVIGVVHTNLDSSVLVERFEEVLEDGSTFRTEVQRMVSYGIAALLFGYWDWIFDFVDKTA